MRERDRAECGLRVTLVRLIWREEGSAEVTEGIGPWFCRNTFRSNAEEADRKFHGVPDSASVLAWRLPSFVPSLVASRRD